MMDATAPTQAMREAIRECTSCAIAAKEALTFSLAHGAEHAEADHLRLLMDCAQICQTSADFLLRASPLNGDICRACAIVCRAVGADASDIGTPELLRLAEHCRACATACDTMAAAADVRAIANRDRKEPVLYA